MNLILKDHINYYVQPDITPISSRAFLSRPFASLLLLRDTWNVAFQAFN